MIFGMKKQGAKHVFGGVGQVEENTHRLIFQNMDIGRLKGRPITLVD